MSELPHKSWKAAASAALLEAARAYAKAHASFHAGAAMTYDLDRARVALCSAALAVIPVLPSVAVGPRTKTIAELEQLLQSVMKGKFSSLTIGCNDDSAPDYASVAEAIERAKQADWVSDEERTKAIETNMWWYAQVYPNTPVGFTRFDASSLSAVVAAIEEWSGR